ncbi:MAG TPA: nucleoside 2-deoxyribosyltransferase domain-containing protein [Planctomycetota bacterium]|nr:nucleoside 2-deoxyribosyltransferase domain-containing protein [Planctomycetota bacterium]
MTTRYVKAPQYPAGPLPKPWIFLAGGIPGCRDWQHEMTELLLARLQSGTIFNPRREIENGKFDAATRDEQITWEFRRLWDADILAFWFCRPTLNPTTLFEFGTHMARRRCNAPDAPVIIPGIDPGYAKENGLRVQIRLLDPELRISRSVEELADATAAAADRWRDGQKEKGDAA